ncbi:alcohol dehydrogenase catalytic domain-containing protein [Rubrobacter radiotolerans]|uniref:Alcohol dehydrogenase catalytic domain-containing protein n=1 Tax=Rubrobacter radiotolerans TaxID=42256 RepID=A0AB35T7R8_RUBRA|nr:alcohol dehydrogenase catalytic domain-containing protein [Rubrobacter radiotolerans]MDX5895573.1 alcohol dehydrogenase catalytic domain-containing protein [Rubrobacter radiotolerans]SMC01497.1 L-iditol 2-dehydrogenase [Rubrobacter radiotolerans DSM 5868]
MIAAVFHGIERVDVEEVDKPSAGSGEVVVKVGANTICGTDVRILRGQKTKGITPPVVLGHELAGSVAEVGKDVEGFEAGDAVVVSPQIPCGRCARCRRDLENLCVNIRILGYDVPGGLAEYVKVPREAVAAGCIFPASGSSSFEELALAEPLACCINGHEKSGTGLGDTVVVLGAGPIGLFHLQLSLLAGARDVIVSEPSRERREAARSFGATQAVEPEELAETVQIVTDGEGADVAVVCIGIPDLVNEAIRLARPGGRVNVFAGLSGAGWAEVEANLIHYKELVVTGSANSRRRDFETAISLIEGGRVDARRMVTHRYPLAEAVRAIEKSASGEAIKVAVTPGG